MTAKRNFKHIVKRLRIKDGDILAIQHGTWLAKRDKIEMLGEFLGKSSRGRCLVIVLNDLDDVANLNEQAMNKHGWYKLRKEN